MTHARVTHRQASSGRRRTTLRQGDLYEYRDKAPRHGQIGLIGGTRVSKADMRVETYETIDELGAQMGFASPICEDEEVCDLAKSIQRRQPLVINSAANTYHSRHSHATLPVEYTYDLNDTWQLLKRLIRSLVAPVPIPS